MDESRFDALTRRHFGLATGGILASLLGLLGLDDTDAKRRHSRIHKRRQRRRQKRRRRNQNQNPPGGKRPDIILINVDDMREDDFIALPQTTALLRDDGMTYPNFFLATPLCAPSRATLFRGQYAHNHGVRRNSGTNGGWATFHDNGADESTIAVWLRDADPSYRTTHIGKHMNGYTSEEGNVPPGWSDWFVPAPVSFFNYTLNANGSPEEHGNQDEDYLTDVMAEKARSVIATTPADTPLFLYFAPKAPHGPATPAPRHQGEFASHELDQSGSFNEADMSDKPEYMQRDPLTQNQINTLETNDRKRLESLLAVDEAVAGIVDALDQASRLEDAYIFFVTDNGYLLGEHRRSGKNVPYEEAIRMSMLVRGPGIRGGETVDAMVANIDLAPTIADLAGVQPPGFVDGRSFAATLDGAGHDRQALLIEMFPGQEQDPEEVDALDKLLAQAEPTSTRRAIRTNNWLYVEHGTGERELYDLHADLDQMESLHEDPDYEEDAQGLSDWLATLRDCSTASCHNAENGPPSS